ncbi:MAG: DUF192 domain-containing protein [bacterium]
MMSRSTLEVQVMLSKMMAKIFTEGGPKVHYRNLGVEMQGNFAVIRLGVRALSSCRCDALWRSLCAGTGVLVTVLFLAACQRPDAEAVFQTPRGPVKVFLERAETQLDRSRGLMFRDKLDEDRGMLFVFPTKARPSFWMKNTFLSLDLLFLSEEGTVLELIERLPPCPMDPCPVYQPQQECRYALEVSGGFAAKHRIGKGCRVVLRLAGG